MNVGKSLYIIHGRSAVLRLTHTNRVIGCPNCIISLSVDTNIWTTLSPSFKCLIYHSLPHVKQKKVQVKQKITLRPFYLKYLLQWHILFQVWQSHICSMLTTSFSYMRVQIFQITRKVESQLHHVREWLSVNGLTYSEKEDHPTAWAVIWAHFTKMPQQLVQLPWGVEVWLCFVRAHNRAPRRDGEGRMVAIVGGLTVVCMERGGVEQSCGQSGGRLTAM